MNKPLNNLNLNAKLLLMFGGGIAFIGFLLAAGISAAFAVGSTMLGLGAFLILLGAIASFLAGHAAALIEAASIRDER